MIYRVHTSCDQRHKNNYDKESKGIDVVKQKHDKCRGKRADAVKERGALSVRADACADLLCEYDRNYAEHGQYRGGKDRDDGFKTADLGNKVGHPRGNSVAEQPVNDDGENEDIKPRSEYYADKGLRALLFALALLF